MSFAVVTSCSLKGWKDYGLRFVNSFDQFWPDEVDLYVVSENILPTVKSQKRNIIFVTLDKSSMALEFLHRHAGEPWVAGDARCPRPPGIAPRWTATEGLWFRWDAWKFCKKVFAVEMVAQTAALTCDRLFWIDADVVTFAGVPADLAERMMPVNYALACLARVGYHSECGFIGYNLKHPAALYFIRKFAELYHSDEIFRLTEWHDSFAFDVLRRQLVTPTYEIPHGSISHPFINSELGRYMDHLKGKRKEYGRSSGKEQHKHQNLPYWQGR